ncbi:MAG TPA: hypothetical protein P5075_05930 [Eubacteriales bacterium]|nr:hypothetical protein [Eubacteriales bacterium]
MGTKKFTLKTAAGSWRFLALFLAIVLLCSAVSQLIITQGYKIQISTVTYEVRGAELNFELYKPADASSDNKLPCIILAHGGSESLAANSLNAWELAKRGFVVLNVSMYSCGLSGQPAINDGGTTEENYFRGGTQGLYDALQYARSIAYVDTSRIAMWGHSAGYICESSALLQDGEYLTLNDRLLNVLHDELGVEITEDQLTQNADDIAAAELSTDQLAVYNYRKTEVQEIVDGYVKGARIIEFLAESTVVVAGYEVVRNPQTNFMVSVGSHEDGGTYYYGETDQYKSIFHTGTDNVERNTWYSISDYTVDPTATSTEIGSLFDTTAENSAALADAIDSGTARIFINPETFHNGMLWDGRAIKTTVEFYTQVLGYNNGNFGENESTAIDSTNLTSSYVALGFTTMAFLAMIGVLISLIAILLKTTFFATVFKPVYTPKLSTKDTGFYIAAVFAFIAGFLGVWFNSMADLSFSLSNATATKWLPWEPGQMRTFMMIIGTAIPALILFLILWFITRKKNSGTLAKISDVNVGCGWKTFFKTCLLALILFSAFYVIAAFIKEFFNTRFLIADGTFEMMKPYGFMRTFKYALILLPFTLIISTLNNMWSLKNVTDSQDTAINVLVTSLGAEVLILISILVTYSTPQHAVLFNLHTLLPIIIYAPVLNYLYRKIYKLTGNVWLGAMMVAIILGWRLSSYISHQFIYWGPNELSAFWGIY